MQHQNNCKTDCPACSRVCPEVAIMFPKYRHGPINGEEVKADDMRREAMKVDISALLGGDIYSLLRDRSVKAKSRFSKERDDERALKERQTCLIALQRDLDVPAEVLAALPSAERSGQGRSGAAPGAGGDPGREPGFYGSTSPRSSTPFGMDRPRPSPLCEFTEPTRDSLGFDPAMRRIRSHRFGSATLMSAIIIGTYHDGFAHSCEHHVEGAPRSSAGPRATLRSAPSKRKGATATKASPVRHHERSVLAPPQRYWRDRAPRRAAAKPDVTPKTQYPIRE